MSTYFIGDEKNERLHSIPAEPIMNGYNFVPPEVVVRALFFKVTCQQGLFKNCPSGIVYYYAKRRGFVFKAKTSLPYAKLALEIAFTSDLALNIVKLEPTIIQHCCCR